MAAAWYWILFLPYHQHLVYCVGIGLFPSAENGDFLMLPLLHMSVIAPRKEPCLPRRCDTSRRQT
ncbi:hypothetical protein JMJ77_0011809 [Colletotrichum scovillei]|uniref:Uncharacterized protein n=1 Tax=Colletotrichum scovillei TaxID=1209932 RepID=A0A9P7UAF7_9PEZI|nr:hypothetical protein JMJ77_0011809 [Colletotrichum scovillei]KAG7046090.1 hypothetical protein JMJ78_0011159 [Colletotrichum scovillei]KAG7063438.1 hypothetical protein JMJ76_0005904 [Colletotrichum scovillei]